jgi:hypothetical protein
VCCGTKRLTEIACPSDCVYLVAARDHPPAKAVRQQQQDVATLVRALRDLTEKQSRFFLVIGGFLAGYEPDTLHGLTDGDVEDAARALAGTLETASRGVIYEHPAASASGGRLLVALKALMAESKESAGLTDRDRGLVLRRVEASVREMRSSEASTKQPFLALIRRVVRPADGRERTADSQASPRLIVP